MANPNTIYAGSVNVTAGSLTVTGVGTSWQLSGAEGGWFSCLGQGIPIAAVASDTSLTLEYGWTGPTAAGAQYSIWRMPSAAADVIDASSRLAEMVRRLQSGSFLQPGAAGRATDRAAYDGEERGFVFARSGDIGTAIQISIKLSDTNADWSPYVPLQGPAGSQGLPGTNGTNGVGNYYDPNIQIIGRPPEGEIYKTIFVRSVTFASALSGSRAKCTTAPTGIVVISVRKNDVQFGTITFAIGATTGVFAGVATTLAAGDILSFVAPTPRDATFADVLITLAGTRN